MKTVYQVLLAIGAVATAFGLLNLAGAAEYLVNSLDTLWAAVVTLIGVVTAIIGFVKHTSVGEIATTDLAKDKVLVGQILAALGFVASFLGIAALSTTVKYLITNLDTIFAALTTIVGIVTTLIGYFKSKK